MMPKYRKQPVVEALQWGGQEMTTSEQEYSCPPMSDEELRDAQEIGWEYFDVIHRGEDEEPDDERRLLCQ